MMKNPRALLNKRMQSLKKKASELVRLCYVQVCVASFDHNGNISSWPENRDTAKQTMLKFKALRENKKPKNSFDFFPFLQERKRQLEREHQKLSSVVGGDGSLIQSLSEESLVRLDDILESRFRDIQNRKNSFHEMMMMMKGKEIAVLNGDHNNFSHDLICNDNNVNLHQFNANSSNGGYLLPDSLISNDNNVNLHQFNASSSNGGYLVPDSHDLICNDNNVNLHQFNAGSSNGGYLVSEIEISPKTTNFEEFDLAYLYEDFWSDQKPSLMEDNYNTRCSYNNNTSMHSSLSLACQAFPASVTMPSQNLLQGF